VSNPPLLGEDRGGKGEPRVTNPSNRCQLDDNPRKWPRFMGTEEDGLIETGGPPSSYFVGDELPPTPSEDYPSLDPLPPPSP
jgi:hypothetical protein